MSDLRHFVFLEKHLVNIENTAGAKLNISSINDVTSSDLLLFLLESTGIVHLAFKKLGDDNVLTCISFKSFEFEGVNVFFCNENQFLITLGKDNDVEGVKFNVYNVPCLPEIRKNPIIPKLTISIPLIVNDNFKFQDVIKIAISNSTHLIAVSYPLSESDKRAVFYQQYDAIPLEVSPAVSFSIYFPFQLP